MKGLLKLSGLLLILFAACNTPKQENYSLTGKLDSLFATVPDYNGAVLNADKEKYEYNTTGYLLLASIAEKASGKDLTESKAP